MLQYEYNIVTALVLRWKSKHCAREDAREVRKEITVTEKVKVIARGAGTSLSGGALPSPDAVVVGLARLNRILDIDPLARTATVEPGVRNLAISEAAAVQPGR